MQSDNSDPTLTAPKTALVTGVSREIGIGLATARRLRADGMQVVTAGWTGYDKQMPWGADETQEEPGGMIHEEADFEDSATAIALVARARDHVGQIDALVLCHCESVDSDIFSTTIESFDRHMAVNARATWQLIKAYAEQFAGPPGTGRIVAITSDHTAGNLPYGASKGAMDRIVIAAATELSSHGVTTNVINPGATDTGWMSDEIKGVVRATNLQPRLGQPDDTANLVSFLCSGEGQWMNAQVLYSDGGQR